MNNFEFLKSLTEKTNNLDKLFRPLHLQLSELSTLTDKNIQSKVFSAILPSSQLLQNINFQKGLLSTQLAENISRATLPLSKLITHYDFAKIKVPDTTLNALINIGLYQNNINQNILQSLSSLSQSQNLKIPSLEFSKIIILNTALTSLSTSIANIATLNNDWDILEEYEDITSEVISFTEEVFSDNHDDNIVNIEVFFKDILDLISKYYSKYKEAGALTLRAVEIFLIFASMHQYYDFLQTKPDLATKQDIKEIKDNQKSIEKYLKETKSLNIGSAELYVLKVKSVIKLKPNKKSIDINILPKNYNINIIKIQPTWVLISYSDPKDGTLQFGYVNKENIIY